MYRKSLYRRRYERKAARCAAMRAAKARKREQQAVTDPGWRRVASMIVTVDAAPDGRTVAIYCAGLREWFRCGSERAVRGALARMICRLAARRQGSDLSGQLRRDKEALAC